MTTFQSWQVYLWLDSSSRIQRHWVFDGRPVWYFSAATFLGQDKGTSTELQKELHGTANKNQRLHQKSCSDSLQWISWVLFCPIKYILPLQKHSGHCIETFVKFCLFLMDLSALASRIPESSSSLGFLMVRRFCLDVRPGIFGSHSIFWLANNLNKQRPINVHAFV